jgi:flagellar biosynthetic protein FliP
MMFLSVTKRSGVAHVLGTVFLITLIHSNTLAETGAVLPNISVNIGNDSLGEGSAVPATLKIMFLLTALSFAPAMLLTMTCFTRIVVVLSMTRTAMGTQQAPPNMVLTGLALFLTMAIMGPIFSRCYNDGLAPYMDGSMGEEEAWNKGTKPLRDFMLNNTKESDLKLFMEIAKQPEPKTPDDVSMIVLIPAFVVSELNLAFQIGFLIALPFLVLDMVVSSVLTSMSMITLPPVVISLPLKLMLFVVVDGWSLIISSLVKTYSVN